MILIDNKLTNDPAFNLAVEETLLRQKDDHKSYLLLYVNNPAVVIGRHQNIYEEVNLKMCHDLNIPVIRRISGGGAVYHDLGNLNFSFINDNSPRLINNYHPFLQPIISALNEMGVKAEKNERNDIVIEGYKISGTAQFTTKERMLTHGTLLYNADLEKAQKLLTAGSKKQYYSKSKKSFISSINNISAFTNKQADIMHFKNNLLYYLQRNTVIQEQNTLTEKIINSAESLLESRYRSWDWNYGRSPVSDFIREIRYPFGDLKLRMIIKKGIFNEVAIVSDFIPQNKIRRIENLFIGQKSDILRLKQITNKIKKMNIKPIDWLELLFGE